MRKYKEKLDNAIREIGIDPQYITLENKIALILHYLPALIKDGHLISFGAPETGKTTAIRKSTEKIQEILSISSASFFGNKKK